jgi:anti-anti-sigma factor
VVSQDCPEKLLEVAQPPFRLDVDWTEAGAEFALSGEFCTMTAPRFLEEIGVARERRVDWVVVDLGGLTFLDAAGIAAFAQVAGELPTGHFTIRRPNPWVLEVLRLCDMDVYVRDESQEGHFT